MKCKAVVSIGESRAEVHFTYTAEDAHNNSSMADVGLTYIDTQKYPYARVEYVVAE